MRVIRSLFNSQSDLPTQRAIRFERPLRTRPCAIALAVAALPLAVSPTQAAQLTATWIGGSGGQYGVASNWDIAQVPLNNASNTYIVQIGPSKSVNYQVTTARTIDQFLLDVASPFTLTGTSLIQPTDLTVSGRALIASSIGANNASFTALGAGTSFLGSGVTLAASNSGVIRIGATSMDVSGFSNTVFLNAAGANSLIDLPSLTAINSGFNANGGGAANTVSASAGAAINMPSLLSLTAPTAVGSLTFNVIGGSTINLQSLQRVAGVTIDSGYTRFNADGGNFVLGPLQTANRMLVALQNASTMSIGGYAGQAALTNSTFSVVGGSKVLGSALLGSFSVAGIANTSVLSAAGLGSLLDLSGLQAIDSGFNANGGGAANSITASDRAVINLSNVKTLVAPTAVGSLTFSAISGSSINLASLQTLSGVTIDSGYTRFGADNASIALGPLQSANRMVVDLQNASTMSVGGYAGIAALTNSTFNVAGGSRLNGAALVGTFAVRGLSNANVLTAGGLNSLLDLSGLQSIDSGFNANGGGASNSVSAADNALVKLSSVTAVIAPTAVGSLTFSAIGGGRIDLSALQSMAGVTVDTGYTRFNGDSGTFILGPLQSANRMVVDLQNGSTMTVGGYGGVAALTNSTFNVAGGSRLNAATLVGSYAVRGIANATVISASGLGSVLDASGLTSIDSNFSANGGGASNVISASDRATLNLGGVTAVISPTSVGSLIFSSSGAANLNLSSLQTFNTATGGFVQLNATSGGSIALHGMAAGTGVRFSLGDAGSNMSFSGGLSLLTGSTLSATAGSRISLAGNYSFQQTVESQMNLDAGLLVFNGSGLQMLEVGGAHITSLVNGTAVNANFGIGELDVGQVAGATIVQLQDAVNNGNRSGSQAEALYLNGVAGGNGLRILGGSTLALNGLDLYATINGSWTYVNGLFPSGVQQIAYDQGFIRLGQAVAVPEPGTWALFALGLGVVAGRRLRQRAQAD